MCASYTFFVHSLPLYPESSKLLQGSLNLNNNKLMLCSIITSFKCLRMFTCVYVYISLCESNRPVLQFITRVCRCVAPVGNEHTRYPYGNGQHNCLVVHDSREMYGHFRFSVSLSCHKLVAWLHSI